MPGLLRLGAVCVLFHAPINFRTASLSCAEEMASGFAGRRETQRRAEGGEQEQEQEQVADEVRGGEMTDGGRAWLPAEGAALRLPLVKNPGSFCRITTITAILEADADGTPHVPLPAELRHRRIKVKATLEAAPEKSERPAPESALAARRQLRAFGTFKRIGEPVAWQREIRMAPDFDEPLEDFKDFME